MTLEQIVKQSQGEQYVYPDLQINAVLILYFLMINFMP